MVLCDDMVGAMLAHNLSKLPVHEQERIRAEFGFDGSSLGDVDKDMALALHSPFFRNEQAKARELLAQQSGGLPQSVSNRHFHSVLPLGIFGRFDIFA